MRTLPVVAPSAYGRAENKTRFLDGGFNMRLTKPMYPSSGASTTTRTFATADMPKTGTESRQLGVWSLETGDYSARYFRCGKPLAIATINRTLECLVFEVELEQRLS